jgi:hypothetical protein
MGDLADPRDAGAGRIAAAAKKFFSFAPERKIFCEVFLSG